MMLTRHSCITWLTLMLFVFFSHAFSGSLRCDCSPAHEAEAPVCVECVFDAPLFLHESPNSLEADSSEPQAMPIATDHACPSDGFPAGIFRPPTAHRKAVHPGTI